MLSNTEGDLPPCCTRCSLAGDLTDDTGRDVGCGEIVGGDDHGKEDGMPLRAMSARAALFSSIGLETFVEAASARAAAARSVARATRSLASWSTATARNAARLASSITARNAARLASSIRCAFL